ncbi:hypothetical protein MASR2M17_18460 [Aminivibrio sp.]
MKKELREFLKDTIRQTVDFSATEQNLGYPPPPVQKPLPPGAEVVPLPRREEWKSIGDLSVDEGIARRHSVRKYLPSALSKEELAFLLWATRVCGGERASHGVQDRSVGRVQAPLRDLPRPLPG